MTAKCTCIPFDAYTNVFWKGCLGHKYKDSLIDLLDSYGTLDIAFLMVHPKFLNAGKKISFSLNQAMIDHHNSYYR